MRKPNPDRYPRSVGAIVSTLTGIEKADLYAQGRTPDRLDSESQKVLRAAIKEIWAESDSYPIYDRGASARAVRDARSPLLDAAQSTVFKCLNPIAVLEEIDALCQRKNEFEWLQQDPIVGGYHDVKTFRETLQTRLLLAWEYEFYVASGLVQEQQYVELFEKYVQHVSAWVKKERLYNRVTQKYEDADEKMMVELERLLDVRAEPSEWRQQFIGAIAAWALDHSGQKVGRLVGLSAASQAHAGGDLRGAPARGRSPRARHDPRRARKRRRSRRRAASRRGGGVLAAHRALRLPVANAPRTRRYHAFVRKRFHDLDLTRPPARQGGPEPSDRALRLCARSWPRASRGPS